MIGTPKRYEIPYLRAWRLYKLMNHGELAQKAGVGRNTITRLEHAGERANELTVYKLARALGISVDQLLGEEPPKNRAA